jgi:hypothetical protein
LKKELLKEEKESFERRRKKALKGENFLRIERKEE